MTSYFLKKVLPFILALVATWWWTIAHANIPKNADNERAKVIHQSVLTIDSHIDWPIRQILNPGFDPGIGHQTKLPKGGRKASGFRHEDERCWSGKVRASPLSPPLRTTHESFQLT
jgi:hypothetical protein